MKLRYFYKIDHNKLPIPGSNVRRKSSPGNQWKEITDPCCNPTAVSCSCGPRYFIQLDGKHKPVDGTLIKRFSFPEMTDGVKFYEIESKSFCCGSITWDLDILTTTGSMVIKANGVEKVNINHITNGQFKPNDGDTIQITLNNTGGAQADNTITIVGGLSTVQHNAATPTLVYSFTFDANKTYHVSGLLDAPGR